MAPLFPLIHPRVLEPAYLSTLVAEESLLLGVIIGIASRYSNVLEPERAAQIHSKVAQWIRAEITSLMDGDLELRSTSTVEALLLLSEWPMLPASRKRKTVDEPDSEEARLLRPSLRYDAYCWSNIGGCETSVPSADGRSCNSYLPGAWDGGERVPGRDSVENGVA